MRELVSPPISSLPAEANHFRVPNLTLKVESRKAKLGWDLSFDGACLIPLEPAAIYAFLYPPPCAAVREEYLVLRV